MLHEQSDNKQIKGIIPCMTTVALVSADPAELEALQV